MPRYKNNPTPQLTAKQIVHLWKYIQRGGPDDCWPWSGARDKDGYGTVGFGYRTHRVTRLVVFLTTGIDPSGFVVLHSCDNPPCCNPNHLKAGTQKENCAYKINNPAYAGENSPNAVLTQAIVDSMRERVHKGERMIALAREFHVSVALVSQIVWGRAWKLGFDPEKAPKPGQLMGGEHHPRRKLTDEQYRFAGAPESANISNAELGRRFGVSDSLICMIRKGKTRKHLKAT